MASANEGQAPPARLRRLWGIHTRERAIMLLAGLLLAAIYTYFWARLYRGYLLVRDDPANIGGTLTGGLRGWFARGMAGYYHVYPEWPQPGFSNFYRPAWNLIVFAEQAVFGQHYWAWFLGFCALQYAGTLLFLRLLRVTGVPSRPGLLFAVLFLFNPAFLNSGFLFPGFQFDVFASLLLLGAFYQLLKHRYGLALALITVAVFTKETAIFAPVAASATVIILKRDAKWAVAMLTPLLAWIAARWLAFHAVMGGTFASPTGIGDIFVNIGKGLIVWPSGAVPADFPLPWGGVHGMALLGLLLVNAALWLVLIYAAWQTARALWQTPDNPDLKRQAIFLVWFLGALCYCLLTRPQVRFGASLYLFALLFLGCFLFARPRPKHFRFLAILILSGVTLLRGGHFLWTAAAKASAESGGEQALFDALRALPQDGRAVFVVNAPAMLSAPMFIAKAWHLNLNLTFISQFRGCAGTTPGGARYEVSGTYLTVQIPSCASYVFAGVPEDVQSKLLAGDFLRLGIGRYEFPRPGNGTRLDSGDTDFGRLMEVRFLSAPQTVLVYDWRKGVYRVLRPIQSHDFRL